MVLIFCLAMSCARASRAGDGPGQYEVKASFLLNFAKFVDWPSGAFPNNRAPLNLCVFGEDPFGMALDKIILGKRIDGREIVALRKRRVEDLRVCQIIFVSRSEDRILPEVLSGLKSATALVVGESTDFAARGGEIQFYMDENKVRFSVNVDALQRSRLTLSAKLLAIAHIVHDESHSNGG